MKQFKSELARDYFGNGIYIEMIQNEIADRVKNENQLMKTVKGAD